MRTGGDVIYFESLSDLRDWLAAHHANAGELWVGFYKKHTGKRSLTYPEAVDEALCFGWIDGIRKRIDDESYMNRFTPRTARSTWSAVNIKRVGELRSEGRMQPSGQAAFERRGKVNAYSYEQATAVFDPALETEFQANPAAWEFFQTQPPSYRRVSIWWVMSAKKEETRRRRLATLIEASAENRRLT